MPPLAKDNFDLLLQEFRDGLTVRYGAPITVVRALDCRKRGTSGAVPQVCDTIHDFASMVWCQIVKEPIIEESHENFSDVLLLGQTLE